MVCVVQENEAKELLDELIERLGCLRETECGDWQKRATEKTPEQNSTTNATHKYVDSSPVNKLYHTATTRSEEHQQQQLRADKNMGRVKNTNIQQQQQQQHECDHHEHLLKLNKTKNRRRPRVASLDECQSILMPNVLVKGKRFSTLYKSQQEFGRRGGENKSGKHSVATATRSRIGSEGSCLFEPEKQLKSSGCQTRKCLTSYYLGYCSEDTDDEFDLSLSFLDSYDEINETYNEAFPTLVEATGHLIAFANCQAAFITHRDQESEDSESNVSSSRGASLPPNPISKGQPVWSTKVKAPVGRPLNQKYKDAELSKSIIEEPENILSHDDFAGKLRSPEKDSSSASSSSDPPLSCYSSLLFDYEFDISILNMMGFTPEKLSGLKELSTCSKEDSSQSADIADVLSTVSKCTKDLFQSKASNNAPAADGDAKNDLDKELLSPDLSKIWDKKMPEGGEEVVSDLFGSSSKPKQEKCGDCLPHRKLSNGTINADPVWMPTEADLGSCLSVDHFVTSLDPNDISGNHSTLLGNVAITLPTADNCFELLAGFPALLLSPESDDTDELALTDSDKCVCGNQLATSFCKCAEGDLFSDIYFSTYNPRLFDLLDLYMLRENMGIPERGPHDLFSLGNFYRKRDIYFDDYFAETLDPGCRSLSSRDSHYSLPPVLTEHFLMEIMKFNEQCSPSTPVGSEFDNGSLYDDRASEVTALQQRAHSLILKHQNMYHETSSCLPKTCDAAMQTEADYSDEEHRFSPTDSLAELVKPGQTPTTEKKSQTFEESAADADGGTSGIFLEPEQNQVSDDANASEPKEFAGGAVGSDYVNDTENLSSEQDFAVSANYSEAVFQCPAGCDPNSNSSQHNHVQEENLLISPKTHFRPISVQSVEEEDNDVLFDEKLTIEQQSFDGIPLPNVFQFSSETKDSRFFSSWCQGIAVSNAAAAETNNITECDVAVDGQEAVAFEMTNDAALRSIWSDASNVNSAVAAEPNGEESWWCSSLDKNTSTSNWVTSSSNKFEATPLFDYGPMQPVNREAENSSCIFDVNPVEELEFVFDHEMSEQAGLQTVFTSHQYPAEFPVGFIPMETLADVDCKCKAHLPGELGIDQMCPLHGAGAAIYLTSTTAADAHSLSSGGEWSVGSNSSLSVLPPTTAINPNVIPGFSSLANFPPNKKKAGKAASLNAANLLQLVRCHSY